ncbi:hypothetical protein SAMN02982929_01708 [Saccharopolyspora kobensis]|uniref:YbaB/EbfC DNA-binding family protein n=1 Tax=Saccharopolyspora kobensis TaxID=146035 RepID=A0A1H5Y0H6_9PSEU|nr:hypothetical protein [Saccharopolyspora kobensis]SEG17504.1 hypothetical protein SAMN02982929_01708 [Saccharopolyspora kobensis]SFF09712.1 hypothetical protein SAMN05216506_11934 [Saccharopolyspora kobensis]
MIEDERTIDELIEIAETITPHTELSAGLDAIRGSARDSGIALEVDLQGMLVGLEIDDRALALGPERLAAEITRLTGEAGMDSLQQGVVAIQAGCGADVAAAMVEYLNSVEEEPDEPEPASRPEPEWEDAEVSGTTMERRDW